jgi:hypothetical protein
MINEEIPSQTKALFERLRPKVAELRWNELESVFGEPIRSIKYSPDDSNGNFASQVHLELKEYLIDDHCVFFLHHISGDIHFTCCPNKSNGSATVLSSVNKFELALAQLMRRFGFKMNALRSS